MTRNTTKLIGTAGVTPGSYILSKCVLTASNGSEFEIGQIVTEIIITESIYSASIDAEMVIMDGVNLFESAKLNGDEKIDLLIKRKSLDTKDTEKHKHTFYISEIIDYARKRNGSASYVLRCVSKHAYVNNTKTLDQFKEGTIGSIIKNICSSDLMIALKELDVNTSTHKNIKCIIPKLRPLAAIKWLNYNSFTTTGAPFYFYETLKGKVKYKSYEDFAASDVVATYIHSPVLKSTIGSDEYFTETSRRIRKLSSDLNLSKYVASGEGAFASTTRSIDIATKTYKVAGQKYNYKDVKKLNAFDPFPKRNNNDQYGGQPIDKVSSGKNYFISSNSLAYGDKQFNFQDPSIESMGKCQAYLSTEDTIVHDIVIAGNFKLESGQIVKIQMNKTGAEDYAFDPIDKMQSGKYLVASIIHKFSDEYTQQVELKSNSFGADLNDILKLDGKKEAVEVVENEG